MCVSFLLVKNSKYFSILLCLNFKVENKGKLRNCSTLRESYNLRPRCVFIIVTAQNNSLTIWFNVQ